jgi:hypothetical protein
MSRMEFETELEAHGPNGAWPKIEIPFSVEQTWGKKARVSVAGTMNGFAFRSSVFPNGDGTHHMMVNKEMREGAAAKPGDRVRMMIEPDNAPRDVTPPEDLAAALAQAPQSAERFATMSYSCKKEYVEWIEQAKQEATRARRIVKAVEMIGSGLRLKG